jgi:peroxiredoxin Q/BCP
VNRERFRGSLPTPGGSRLNIEEFTMLTWTRRVIAAVIAVTFTGATMADDSTLKVKEGDKFPTVALSAAQIEKAIPDKKDAKTISIADLKGKNVVVFFYPRALTGGCTVESCGFRDIADKFPKGTVILGASNDGIEKQNEFIKKNMLPYALLCDTDSKLIKELGIMSAKGNAAQRISFVIDKEGKIAKIYTKVTPKDHPAEVLKQVESMK